MHEATRLLIDFFKAFDSTYKGKRKQIRLAYAFTAETIIAMIMFYKDTKILVGQTDGHSDFIDIVLGVF